MLQCEKYGRHALGNFSMVNCRPCGNFLVCKEMWFSGRGLISLQVPLCAVNRKRNAKRFLLTLMSHDPVAHCLGSPCIYIENGWKRVFRRTTVQRIVRVLTIELVHHTLIDLDEQLDSAWEKFHGYYENATKLLEPK
jgi:hypothetical protein